MANMQFGGNQMGRKVIASAVGLALLATAGCDWKDASGYLAEARQYQQKGDSKAAVIQLKNALQKDPNNGEARYLLGVIYNDTGDGLSAEKELRKALGLHMDAARVMPALGRSLLLQGAFEKVLEEIKPAAGGKGAGVAEMLTLRGNANLSLGRLQDAKTAFGQALEASPDFAGALLGQAQMALTENGIERASALVERVLVKAPGNAEAWQFKGSLQRLRRDNAGAIASFNQALKIKPENINALIGRAYAQMDLGKLDAAQADIAAARKIAPGSLSGAYSQALLDFRRNRHAAALDTLQQVLRAAPEHMPSVLLAGAVEYAMGSLQQAEQHLVQYLDKFPGDLYARKLLVSTLLKGKQVQRAMEVLQPGLQQDPQDVQMMALAGEVYTQARQFAKGAEYLEKAVSLQPQNPTLRTSLGANRLAMGEPDSGISDLESAAKLDSGQTGADIMLALTHLSRKEYDQALEVALRLEKKQPKNPATFNLLGAVYLGKQDPANARKSFERALSLQPDYFPAVMNLAQMDVRAKDFETARKRFKDIIAKEGKNSRAMVALAQLERAAGNAGESVSWLEKAIKADAAALTPRLMLAEHYLQSREPQKALVLLTEAGASHPNHPDVLNLLGQAQFASGDKSNAVATYQSLASSQPQSPLAHYRLATILIATENYPAAKESLNKALKLKPDYLDAEVVLASLELHAGKQAEALKIAQQIQRQYPDKPVGYALEGDTLMAKKQFAQAVKVYDKAYGIARSALLAIRMHQALSLAGDAKAADARLQQWLRENPTDTAARNYLAGAYQSAGQNKAAIEQYQQVLQNDPGNLAALNNLASLYQQAKDPRALELAERAYKRKPDSGTVADTLGWILLEQGKTARGLELLKKAAAMNPQNPEIRFHLASALAKSGDKASARKDLEALLAGGQKFPQREAAQALLDQL
ncbi:MAG: XrtA/PEP-CTERM system TPR-repeat protein PrsT [Betaproteobacteria bacterium]